MNFRKTGGHPSLSVSFLTFYLQRQNYNAANLCFLVSKSTPAARLATRFHKGKYLENGLLQGSGIISKFKKNIKERKWK